MEKVYGSPKRQDSLVKVGRHSYELIYGFGKDSEDAETGYNYRQRFDHKPTEAEIKAVITAHINERTNATILTGLCWNGKPVWLSSENQMNFKSVYDIAVQTAGANLPKKFKLGEDETGEPVYHTFTKLEPFADFIGKVSDHIAAALLAGWNEKDSVDYSKFNAE